MKNSQWRSKTQKRAIHGQEKRKKIKRFKETVEENVPKIKEELNL